MNSLLCNWFDDWGRAIKSGLGTAGVVVFLVVFSIIAFYLFFLIVKAAVTKAKFKWLKTILLAIFILFIVWFSIIL